MRKKSAAELRDELDDDVREFLEDTYGDEPWSKNEATDGVLVLRGYQPSMAYHQQMRQMILVSIGRVRREVENGLQRYWWVEGDVYQHPLAMSEEMLLIRSRGYRLTAAGLLELSAAHDMVRVQKGAEVDTSDLDSLIERLTAVREELA